MPVVYDILLSAFVGKEEAARLFSIRQSCNSPAHLHLLFATISSFRQQQQLFQWVVGEEDAGQLGRK